MIGVVVLGTWRWLVWGQLGKTGRRDAISIGRERMKNYHMGARMYGTDTERGAKGEAVDEK